MQYSDEWLDLIIEHLEERKGILQFIMALLQIGKAKE